MDQLTASPPTRRVLGIEFFHGTVEEAVAFASSMADVVAPAGPALVKLRYDEGYRRALVEADLAIADSGWMVLLWLVLRGRKLNRVSGLKYLECLAAQIFADKNETALWILPSESARTKARDWLERNHVRLDGDELYVAPVYGKRSKIHNCLSWWRGAGRNTSLWELAAARRRSSDYICGNIAITCLPFIALELRSVF